MKTVIFYLFILVTLLVSQEYKSDQDKLICERIIDRTNLKFNAVADYKVDISVNVDIPAIRLPKSNYTVYFKSPDKIKVNAKRFGILPKAGLFESPKENFNDLELKQIIYKNDSLKINEVMVRGYAIFDSLKFSSPNEYFEMLDILVDVRVDTADWVISSVAAYIKNERKGDIPLFKINNSYDLFQSYLMPKKSIAKYYVKDKKISNWLNKESEDILKKITEANTGSESMIDGTIEVIYSNYSINKGIDDKIFD